MTTAAEPAPQRDASDEDAILATIRESGEQGILAKDIKKEHGLTAKHLSTALAGLEYKKLIGTRQDDDEWRWYAVEQPKDNPKRGRLPKAKPKAPDPPPVDDTVPPGSEMWRKGRKCDTCKDWCMDDMMCDAPERSGLESTPARPGFDEDDPTMIRPLDCWRKFEEWPFVFQAEKDLAALPECDNGACTIAMPSESVPATNDISPDLEVFGVAYTYEGKRLDPTKVTVMHAVPEHRFTMKCDSETQRDWLIAALQRLTDDAETRGLKVDATVTWGGELRGDIVVTRRGVRA